MGAQPASSQPVQLLMMQGRAPRKRWHLRHVNDAGRGITHGVLHAYGYFLADARRPRAARRCAQEEGVRTTAAAAAAAAAVALSSS